MCVIYYLAGTVTMLEGSNVLIHIATLEGDPYISWGNTDYLLEEIVKND